MSKRDFKEIAIAYQGRKCNGFGPKESAPEGYIDTEGVHVFGAIFGGERDYRDDKLGQGLYRKPRMGKGLMKILDNRLKGDISYLRKRRRGKAKKGG